MKLPVALSGGSSVNTDPAAGEMLSTTPANLRCPYASTEIVTGCPGRMRLSCVSLKLASMNTSLSGTTLPNRCPIVTKSPVLTRRLENVPSTGARTEVKSRSRSALASAVCNSASCARASACCALVTSTLSRAAS